MITLNSGFCSRVAYLYLILNLLSESSKMNVSGRKIINYNPSEMSRGEIIQYFRSVYQLKMSTLDRVNEEMYFDEAFLEDLYHQVDNFMARRTFVKLLTNTKNITDKSDGHGGSIIHKYPGDINVKCSRTTMFNHTLDDILKHWDGDKIIIANAVEEWINANMYTPYSQICNRFRGLTCQNKVATEPRQDHGKTFEVTGTTTCQCAGDSSVVGFYKKKNARGKYDTYSDGCYVRPWRPCQHLSIDSTFQSSYSKWHKSLENVRRQLAQLAFPVARTHRCKEGTQCLDMVPGMNKPVCWCNPNSMDHECKEGSSTKVGKHIPTGPELERIRTKFMKLVIPANDMESNCQVEYNEDVMKLTKAIERDPGEAVKQMEKLAFSSNQKVGIICDFRQALICDSNSKKCTGNLNCELGKIHLGQGICAVNNGFRCQTNEECVENAKCAHIPGTQETMCTCTSGYGHMCKFEKQAFFAKTFLPIISGYEGEEFIRTQVKINKILESWEDSMSQNVGDRCELDVDQPSMEIVKYFGNLDTYDKDKGGNLLGQVKNALHRGSKLCYYTKFLRCDPSKLKCVPLLGDGILRSVAPMNDDEPKKIFVEIAPKQVCSHEIPKVFKGSVMFVCSKGYACKRMRGAPKCYPDCFSMYAPAEFCKQLVPETTPFLIDAESLEEETKDLGKRKIDDEDVETEDSSEIEFLNSAKKARANEDTEDAEAAASDSNVSETNTTDSSLSETNTTDASLSETNTTDASLSETNTTDASLSETNTTDASLSETNTTDASLSETNTTDASLSETNTTDASLSETNTTDPNASETNTTDPNVPEATPIDVDVPETNITDTSVSETNTTDPGDLESNTTEAAIGITADTNMTTTIPMQLTTEAEQTFIAISNRPLSKQGYQQTCIYNDDRSEYPYEDTVDICDREMYLVCKERICQCYPGLKFAPFKNKCALPVGELCAEFGVQVPAFMNKKLLPCEFGVCISDPAGKICKPENDRRTILIDFDENLRD